MTKNKEKKTIIFKKKRQRHVVCEDTNRGGKKKTRIGIEAFKNPFTDFGFKNLFYCIFQPRLRDFIVVLVVNYL